MKRPIECGAMTFEEVYRRFRRPVWSLARQFLGSENDALDATQEIFVRVWKGLPGFRGDAKLSTWVFQIAWNYLRSEAQGFFGDQRQDWLAAEAEIDERLRKAGIDVSG